MTDIRRVLGLCGSLRERSYNRAALDAAGELMPESAILAIGDFSDVPVYNADHQAAGWPAAVLALGDAVRHADAVLIASPEYNFSIPGGLKNALDWLSRLPEQPFKGKPVAIMGAATGPVGTARMQYDLRRVLQFLDAEVLQKPEIFIAHAATKVNADGRLVDETTRRFIGDQMRALVELTARTRSARPITS
ncbi:NAD(P)H-dependent oxidoreductase [Aquincola sp. S2]|uniref:NAD(P)H-dependent oxidoreductase n=1 Tax=Pseudaquabacterium terrae TaxID=2732868 RepID=A0ABX2EGF4_9BURK|nr:NADPH-dependent FMN reductase [Aquabacterium terrae]NRF67725.1 NAD(P)H-dependent oxidoreductase [Aquabacterium terrae]